MWITQFVSFYCGRPNIGLNVESADQQLDEHGGGLRERIPGANQLLCDVSSLEIRQKTDATECVGSMAPVGMIDPAGVSFT